MYKKLIIKIRIVYKIQYKYTLIILQILVNMAKLKYKITRKIVQINKNLLIIKVHKF